MEHELEQELREHKRSQEILRIHRDYQGITKELLLDDRCGRGRRVLADTARRHLLHEGPDVSGGGTRAEFSYESLGEDDDSSTSAIIP